jgi:hypothetical protein
VAITLFITSCSKNESEDSLNSNVSKDEQVIENDDISYVGSDTILGLYIENLANEIRAYKKSNPIATDKDLDSYANRIIKHSTLNNQLLSQRGYTDMDGYITKKLNSQEQALYNSNKAKGLLCMANGQLAVTYAEKYYISGVLHNGNGDAFRHTLWNFGMTIDVGSTFAKTWSDAHEYGTLNQPPLERTMDLYNNGIGIQLGKDYPNTFLHSTFISKSKDKAKSGKLRVIVSNKLAWSNSYGEK